MKYIALTDGLYDYVRRHRSEAGEPILAALREETRRLGDEARMQISEEQGAFLSILTAAIGARSAIEVGTFTGYSSICIARGLPEGGRLLCVDASHEWTEVARRYWAQAGVDPKIELRVGAAIPVLDGLPPDASFDLAFIDAAKTEYLAYYERLLPRVRPNGLLLFDNMLWGGRLGNGDVGDESAKAIHALNATLSSDPRVEAVLLPVADGIQLCRKR